MPMSTSSRAGYQAGYFEGYRFGGCQAVLARIPPQPVSRRNIRVLYVPQSFEAIDRGVTAALSEMTAECIVASPETLLEAAITNRPDLVLVMNGLHVFPDNHVEHIQSIREMGIRTAIWFVDDPYFTDETSNLAKAYDVIFTHEQECIHFYREMGCSVIHYLPLAAEPSVFRPVQTTQDHQFDVCFIGNAFWNRVELFDQMCDFLQNKKVFIAGGHWDRLSQYDQLSKFIRNGWVAVEETVSYYNGSKIVINLHRPTTAGQDNRNSRDISGGSINPRTYEIGGCGTLQITDIRSDLLQYYRPGYDIETFQDVKELQDKIDYYLKHEKERQAIAWRCLRTTRQYHTFTNRIERLLAAAF